MVKTTGELDPGKALSIQNLVVKNDKQLGAIYEVYNDQFKSSHIASKEEFVRFIKDYKTWREQMLRALPGIIAHLQKHRESVPDFKVVVEQALLDHKIYNSHNELIVRNAEFVAENILDALQTNYDEFFDFQLFIRRLSEGLEVYVWLFGTKEETKSTAGTPTKSGAFAGAGSSAASGNGPTTDFAGEFSVGNKVVTVVDAEIYIVNKKGELIFDSIEPKDNHGIIIKGPIKVKNNIWYLVNFNSGYGGWVKELELRKVNTLEIGSVTLPPAAASGFSSAISPKFKIGDKVRTKEDTWKGDLPAGSRGVIVAGPGQSAAGFVTWKVKFDTRWFKKWISESYLELNADATVTVVSPPPLPPGAKVHVSKLTGAGPTVRINLEPTPPPRKSLLERLKLWE